MLVSYILFLTFSASGWIKEEEKKKKEEAKKAAAPAEPQPTKEELLLAEIRDLLKERK